MARAATTTIAIILFVLFGLSYLGHTEIQRHEARTARVLDYAKEYRASLRETNAQFSQRWNEYLNDSVDSYNGGNLSEQAYDDLVNRFLSSDPNRNNYEALAGFYDSIGECVDTGLCDFWLTRTMFGNDIVTFYHNFYPALQTESQQGHSDSGIVDFVNRMRAADIGQVRLGWEDRMIAWTH